MTDINKLLDEIERLVPNVSSLEHWQETEGGGEKEFAGEMIPPDRIAVLQALASEYRKQSLQIREAVEDIDHAKQLAESISSNWSDNPRADGQVIAEHLSTVLSKFTAKAE
jgi:hypothetical protein